MNLDAKEEKQKMTDEERIKLAEKLDKELDEFINGLEKRPYNEGWPEDRWQEEMEKHPFFMTKPPEDGQPISPLMEGLQQLKYSETDNTPEELATTYKEDGNYYFKLKKYRVAIMSYTEGLKQHLQDSQLESELLNNRSAAHFFLKNYRSCLMDCRAALRLRPDYSKSRIRAAQACMFLHNYDDCMTYCDEILATSPTDTAMLELRAKAIAAKKLDDRNKRKQNLIQRKEEEINQKLLETIRTNGIQVENKELSMSSLEPCIPSATESRVHLDETGRLVWPVMFMYPEYQTTDLIKEFYEDSTFSEHLQTMFEVPPDWDVKHVYSAAQLNIYYENRKEKKLYAVPTNSTLQQILTRKSYVVYAGTPNFLIVVRGSHTEKHLLDRYSE